MKDAARSTWIPFNRFPGTRFARSTDEAIRAFQKQLNNAGNESPVRRNPAATTSMPPAAS